MASLDIFDDPKTMGAVLIALLLTVLCTVFFAIPNRSRDTLEITQLYVYPVKGLRGCPLQKAHLGPYGLLGDRTFCLQKVHRETDKEGNDSVRYETLLIGYHLQLALFSASINHKGLRENAEQGEVVVTWHGRGLESNATKASPSNTDDEIRFPLRPSTKGCKSLQVDLHTSTSNAYDMGEELASWFSERLGFESRFVFIGDGSRPVLGSMAPHSKDGLRRARLYDRIRALVPTLSYPPERLAFNDIAHYLVVTEESNDQVSSRLADGHEMDITKFRPNIVVRGASAPFVEDFWGELTFEGGIQMPLTANCYRCQSITVDYNTGKTATDDRGTVWKKINKDRRVDAGAKYSPVFGRYGYCFGSSVVDKSLYIGQKASITHVNSKRTIFDWPHLANFGLSQTKK